MTIKSCKKGESFHCIWHTLLIGVGNFEKRIDNPHHDGTINISHLPCCKRSFWKRLALQGAFCMWLIFKNAGWQLCGHPAFFISEFKAWWV